MPKFFIKIIPLFLIGLFSASFALASSTDGTVDPTYRYAWGENIGWLDFGTANGNVHITDSGLSGYALSETAGWIYLGDIDNDAEGNLSGKAWGENVGWIDFDPANGGVVINSSGEFTGSALSENIGWIIFGGDYKVKTDWRPYGARPRCGDGSCNNGETCSSCSQDCGSCGGGSMPSAWSSPPQTPQGGFVVLINSGASETDSLSVKLSLTGGQDTVRMAISNFSDFHDAGQEPYSQTKDWNLCQGLAVCSEGTYIVYVKFYADWGTNSGVVYDSIVYKEKKTTVEKITEIPDKIIDIIKPKLEEKEPVEVPIEEVVPKESPVVFQNKWPLLSAKPIESFVLSPLPKEISDLAQKFPELAQTFEDLGITKITDIEKLQGVKFTLPGLTERLGLQMAETETGKTSLPLGVPLGNLSDELKKEIPAEIVFAKTGQELIDLNINLTIAENGQPKQTITTISGKPLQLAVKPDGEVNNIKGYIVFLSRKTAEEENPKIFGIELPINYLLGSVISSLAKNQEEPIEQKLVLQEFDYTDSDGDGIWTASIQTPVIEGEYEIITVLDYKDVKIGAREIRLITVVDPEGYIYRTDADGEKARITGATVSLFWLNPQIQQYEIWPASDFQQENPQITNDTGKYSFLVPEGNYYLKVEAKSYQEYQGEKFSVSAGGGVHTNIELKTKNWWSRTFDFKTIVIILLALVIVLLFYNFYRDKRRVRD